MTVLSVKTIKYYCKQYKEIVTIVMKIRGAHKTRVKNIQFNCKHFCGIRKCVFRERYFREVIDIYIGRNSGKKDER